MENPDVASLPTILTKVQEVAKQLSDQDLASILKPRLLNPADQSFIDMHHHLFYLPYSIMFWLLKAGLLPKHFLRLKDRPPPYASCIFGAQHRKNWRMQSSRHGRKSELRKEDLTKPGQCVGVDQKISAQQWLIPQEKIQFNSSKDMGMHSICGLLHWICICGADEGSYRKFDASGKVRVWSPLRCLMSQSRALPCR